MSIPKNTLALIEFRALAHCEICGKWLEDTEYDPHHRQLKSRGGRDEASNLLHICHPCHLKVHASPAWASAYGFMVASWENPEEVAFKHWQGYWVFLKDDGLWLLDNNQVTSLHLDKEGAK